MQKVIKLAYDWYAPEFPLNNNQTSLPEAIEKARNIDDRGRKNIIRNTLFPYRTMGIFKDDPNYEYVPTCNIQDNDHFIYEFTFEIRDLNYAVHNDQNIFKLTHVSDFILNQIKNKNGHILIDISHESVVMQKHENNLMFLLHDYFKEKDIPLNKVILLTGCINGPDLYRKYCIERDIPGRERIIVKNYEWFEFMASRDMHELEYIPPANDNFYKIKKSFLCYNRRFKPHRTDLFVLFTKMDLMDTSFYSMPLGSQNSTTHTSNKVSFNDNYRIEEESPYEDITATKKLFKQLYNLDSDEELDRITKTLPATIDSRHDLRDMIKITDPEQAVYDSSLISVITESNFYSEDIFNTEKTWKAIANKHPFIIVGPQYTLKYLKTLGYKTFSEFFDESYDGIENPTTRLMMIAKLCKSIDNWSFEQKRDFFNEAVKITDYNFNLLKSIYQNKKPLILDHI